MVNDLLQNLMVHLRKNNDLKEGLNGSQDIIGVWSHLVDNNFTNTFLRVPILAALVFGVWLFKLRIFLLALLSLFGLLQNTLLDNYVITLKILVLLNLVKFLLVSNVNLGDESILDINDNRLESTVHLILLNLFLKLLKIWELDHLLFQVYLLPDFL